VFIFGRRILAVKTQLKMEFATMRGATFGWKHKFSSRLGRVMQA
jgi:hypothetical protein